MNERPPHLWAVPIRAALAAFARLGLDADEVCRRAGVEREALEGPEARVPLDVGNGIWAVADALWGRPGLGLYAGSHVPFGAYHALDYLFMTAASVPEGVAAVVRYFRIVTEGATRFESFDVSGEGTIGVQFSGPVPLHVRDYALSLVAARVRRIGGLVLEAQVAGPLLAEPRAYEQLWGVAPSFGQPRSALVIAQGAAAVTDFPELRDIIEREAKRLLGDLEGDRELANARAAIVALLPQGRPRLADVARRLHASPRTVQRRLREHGWTFAGLVDAVRAELAYQHLREPHLSAAEVGYLLGFADPASFTRACARWFGRTPARLREQEV